MKPFMLLIVLLLSGCVAYPAKTISEPRYEVHLKGDNFTSVELSSAVNIEEGTCDGGKPLKQLQKEVYFTDPEYGWLKFVFILPFDSIVTINICATNQAGENYHWSDNYGVFNDGFKKTWKFKCDVKSNVLNCKKST